MKHHTDAQHIESKKFSEKVALRRYTSLQKDFSISIQISAGTAVAITSSLSEVVLINLDLAHTINSKTLTLNFLYSLSRTLQSVSL